MADQERERKSVKTGAVKKYVKKSGSMVLIETGERQWLATGSGLCPLDGWPKMTAEEMMTLMEIPKDEQPTYPMRLQTAEELPEPWQQLMTEAGKDSEAKPTGLTIGAEGVVVQPMYTRHGLKFAESGAIAVLKDSKKEISWWFRETGPGGGALVAKIGMLTAGVIFPQGGWITDEVEEWLADASMAASKAAQRRRETEAETAKTAQLRMEGTGA
jgi:hypothetical protein